MLNELDLPLTYEGTVEVELASGALVEEDVYSGTIRFDGQELVAEIILTDAVDTFIGTGLLTEKVQEERPDPKLPPRHQALAAAPAGELGR